MTARYADLCQPRPTHQPASAPMADSSSDAKGEIMVVTCTVCRKKQAERLSSVFKVRRKEGSQ